VKLCLKKCISQPIITLLSSIITFGEIAVMLCHYYLLITRNIYKWDCGNQLLYKDVKYLSSIFSFFSLNLQPSAGYGLFISQGFLTTHNDASHSVRLLWTCDQLVAQTSTWQHTTDTHPCPRWDSKPRSQQASGRSPTPYAARPLGPAWCETSPS
jgi:hypothetical protein